MRFVEDVAVYDNYKKQFILPEDVVDIISHKTKNTWQPGRNKAEIIRDTDQGKFAELIVEHYILNKTKYAYLSYDSFRNNQYHKHAPIDGIMYAKHKDSNLIYKIINAFNDEVINSAIGSITTKLRYQIRKNGVFTVEIKSTKVSDKKRGAVKHIVKDDFRELKLIKEIKKDDYLAYPRELRYSTISTTNEYINILKKRGLIAGDGLGAYAAMAEYELPQLADIYFRIYIDDTTNTAYIIGFITRFDFFSRTPPQIKKMIKKGKSEGAVYLALPLMLGRSLCNIDIVIDEYQNKLNS